MTIKKTTKKDPTKRNLKSKRSNDGKASVAKGREFEDKVARLYRLQGAEVVQNIEICNKKVDILATFIHPVKHRVIIECKNESKPVDANQRIMQFHGLLTSARRAGEAESAEIITKVPWSDAAKGYAKREGIKLSTYTEKISSLIDFTSYLKELISKFEKKDPARPSEPPQGKYYIDLSGVRYVSGKEVKINVLDTYIKQWLQKEDTPPQNKGVSRYSWILDGIINNSQKESPRHLAIFGEYGAGKSTFCQKLARDLSASLLRDSNSGRIPILLNLREFTGKIDLEAYITSFLDRECKASTPKFALFKEMNDAGVFLLLFDGLDEMAVKVDADTLESNLMEIEKLAASPNSKVILTSRPEFFLSAKEEQEAISPTLNPLLSRKSKYEPIKILPWEEKQIELFLQRRVPLVKEATERWTFYRDKIKSIGKLSDLSQRPVLLDMIVKTLPTLIANDVPIDRPSLYRTYLIGEIKRQRVQKKRTLLISEDDRLSLLQQLAVALNDGTVSAINFTDASRLIAEKVAPPKYELEAHTRDFLTNSFLIRKGDEYHFSHKSILEYLIARQFADEIQSGVPKSFGNTLLQKSILDFLQEFKPETATIFKWLGETKSNRYRAMKFLGGNAATLLCVISKDSLSGKDISRTNLTGADLRSIKLTDVNFDGAFLRHVNLSGARFTKEQFVAATVNNVTILFLIVEPKLIRGEFNEKISQVVRNIKMTEIKKSLIRANVSVEHAGGKYSMAGIQVQLPKKELLRILFTYLRRSFSHIALYNDEIEQLIEEYPQVERMLTQ